MKSGNCFFLCLDSISLVYQLFQFCTSGMTFEWTDLVVCSDPHFWKKWTDSIVCSDHDSWLPFMNSYRISVKSLLVTSSYPFRPSLLEKIYRLDCLFRPSLVVKIIPRSWLPHLKFFLISFKSPLFNGHEKCDQTTFLYSLVFDIWLFKHLKLSLTVRHHYCVF